jgi:transcriptional regulator with XRE-family HTH domain
MEINSLKLKELRESRRWTLEELAAKTGLTATSLSQMERGGGARPKNIKKLADALEVDESIIKGGVQNEGKPADNFEVAEKRDTYIKDTEGEGGKITDLLTRAVEVLESNSIFRQALAANINAFHLAIRSEEKVRSLQGRIDYLEGQNKGLESRLAAVEEKLRGG